jgi:hypothetical protein
VRRPEHARAVVADFEGRGVNGVDFDAPGASPATGHGVIQTPQLSVLC